MGKSQVSPCPNCGNEIPGKEGYVCTLDDGGSIKCPACDTIFHYSSSGDAHLKGPGPKFCRWCNLENR